MTYTAGAIRAAERIMFIDLRTNYDGEQETVANIIDEETNTAEMEAFIDEVAKLDFPSMPLSIKEIERLVLKAQELIKKVRCQVRANNGGIFSMKRIEQ